MLEKHPPKVAVGESVALKVPQEHPYEELVHSRNRILGSVLDPGLPFAAAEYE